MYFLKISILLFFLTTLPLNTMDNNQKLQAYLAILGEEQNTILNFIEKNLNFFQIELEKSSYPFDIAIESDLETMSALFYFKYLQAQERDASAPFFFGRGSEADPIDIAISRKKNKALKGMLKALSLYGKSLSLDELKKLENTAKIIENTEGLKELEPFFIDLYIQNLSSNLSVLVTTITVQKNPKG